MNNKEKEMNGKGRVTIPTDIDVIEGTKELARMKGLRYILLTTPLEKIMPGLRQILMKSSRCI